MWYCEWLVTIQSWGRGCLQQEHAKAAGRPEHYDHRWNGRRLPEAESYVYAKLKAGLDLCNLWHLGSFGGVSQDRLDEYQLCVRSAFTLATKRHAYLSTIPWLFAKLLRPGVKQRCLDLYKSNRDHHPLSHHFLHPEGHLRAHVEQLRPDGSGASQLLMQEVQVLTALPMDDSVAESPHAQGNAIARQAHRCGFAWVASSMRLKQNISDAKLWGVR